MTYHTLLKEKRITEKYKVTCKRRSITYTLRLKVKLVYKPHRLVLPHTQMNTHSYMLSTPSMSTLFSEEVICASLTQVKDDSHLSVLKNLSSLKGGMKSASTSSSSGSRRRDSSSTSSSSRSRGFSWPYRGSKRPASSSSFRRSKVAFKGILHSPTPKKNFLK